MTDNIKNSTIRAYEIMKKNYSPEEIEAFLKFLDKNTKEITRPLVWRINIGFGILAILILVAPGLLQDLIKGNLGL